MKNKSIINSAQEGLHDKYGVFVMFFIVGISLLFSYLFIESHWIILIPIFVLTLYDLSFRYSYKGKWEENGRNYKTTLRGIRAAIQYTVIIIGVIGFIISNFTNQQHIMSIKTLISQTPLLQIYLVSGAIIASLMLLFIPVTYTNRQNEPSIALKNYYFVILLMQKIFMLICIYFAFVFAEEYFSNIHNFESN